MDTIKEEIDNYFYASIDREKVKARALKNTSESEPDSVECNIVDFVLTNEFLIVSITLYREDYEERNIAIPISEIGSVMYNRLT